MYIYIYIYMAACRLDFSNDVHSRRKWGGSATKKQNPALRHTVGHTVSGAMRNLRHTMSHTVCHTAGHTATGGPARSRSHDGFPIGKAREACGMGYVFVLCFCSYFRSFLLARFGCCRAFLASISRPRSSFFNVFGMVFDAPRCGIVILFLDLPLRTGWLTKVAPDSSKKWSKRRAKVVQMWSKRWSKVGKRWATWCVARPPEALRDLGDTMDFL